MVEKLAKDSAELNLAQHKLDVIAAIDENQKGAAEGPKGDGKAPQQGAESDFFNESVFKAVRAVPSLFLTIATQTISGSPPPGQNANSLFVGGLNGGKKNQADNRVSLVPQGYAEKKAAAKATAKASGAKPGARPGVKDIFGKVQIASQSLTGGSAAGGKSTPIKGISVKPAAKGGLGAVLDVGGLLDELATTNKALNDPYENKNRLARDLQKGIDVAEQFVQKKPEVARTLALK